MKGDPVGIEVWLTAFREAAVDLAALSLRFDDSVPPLLMADFAGPSPSAYIAILGESESIHLGLSSTPEGVSTLARALLRIRGDRPLEDRDAVDGLRELLNIVAGKVKSRMAKRDGSLLLGLPMFINGRIQPGADLEHKEVDIRLGPVPCRLSVYRRNRGASLAA